MIKAVGHSAPRSHSGAISFGLLAGGLVLLALAPAGISGAAASVPSSQSDGGTAVAGPAVPASLAQAASTAIGTRGATFRVASVRGVLAALGGGLSSSFTAAGVNLRTTVGVEQIALADAGYGSRLAGAPRVAPVATGSAVVYRDGALAEWYRNGPFGLEQGFTLAHRPTGVRGGPLTLSFSIAGPLKARQSGPGVALTTRDGLAVLSYGAPSARDATGRSLPATVTATGHKLVLRVWDTGARYPLTVDPFIQEVTVTAGAYESGAGEFGYSVAMAADGTSALIGGPENDGGIGAAWVWVLKNGTWIDQHTMYAPTSGGGEETGAGQFGASVALDADGTTAIVGGPENNGGFGAAWVWVLRDDTWIDQHMMTAPTSGPGIEIGAGRFGASVALGSAGNTAVIGGPLTIGAPSYQVGVGAAWVFIRTTTGTTTTWIDQHKLSAPTSGAGMEVGDAEFGYSVAVSQDKAGTVLVGGPYDSGEETKVGAAWVFVHKGDQWIDQHELTPPATEANPIEIGCAFGYSVALSAKGNLALVGAPDDLGGGSAWVFIYSGNTWSDQAKFKADDAIGDPGFGYSVALPYASDDEAVVGGPYDNGGAGAAWLFTYLPAPLGHGNAQGWIPGLKVTAKSGGGDETGAGQFGYSVSISAEGTPWIFGGDKNSGGVGAAWLYPAVPD